MEIIELGSIGLLGQKLVSQIKTKNKTRIIINIVLRRIIYCMRFIYNIYETYFENSAKFYLTYNLALVQNNILHSTIHLTQQRLVVDGTMASSLGEKIVL